MVRLTTALLLAIYASSAFSASRTCKEEFGKDYPCCCVVGNTGVCGSKKDCAELSGECVADKEHFRCVPPNSKAKAMKIFESTRKTPSTLSLSQSGKPTKSQPRPCGDQGKDNRANSCSRLVGGVWAVSRSTCTKAGSTLVYTHCNTVDKLEFDADTHVCSESKECPGAFFVSKKVN